MQKNQLINKNKKSLKKKIKSKVILNPTSALIILEKLWSEKIKKKKNKPNKIFTNH